MEKLESNLLLELWLTVYFRYEGPAKFRLRPLVCKVINYRQAAFHSTKTG